MKKRNKIIILVLALLLVGTIVLVSAGISPITPSLNLDGQNQFTISNYPNITNVDNINSYLYVDSGNATDLEAKIAQSKAAGGGIVYVPKGIYNVTSTINLTGNVILKGVGYETQIKPSGDFDLFILSDYSKLQDLRIITNGVAGFNHSGVTFLDEYTERPNWVYLDNVKFEGLQNTSNTDKAISVIDDSGNGITWITVQNIRIYGYRYGIYLETSHANAYVKALTFDQIFLQECKYGVYENMTAGSAGGIQGNTFNIRMNGNSITDYAVHVEGDDEYFQSIIFDSHLFSSGKSYNITSTSDNIFIIDKVLDSSSLIEDGTNENYLLSDTSKLSPISGNTKFNGYFNIIDDRRIGFGNDLDATMEWDNTGQITETLVIGLGDISRSVIYGLASLRRHDYDHAIQTDPTIYIQSVTDPDDDNTEWLSLKYSNYSNRGEIKTGKGNLYLNPAGNVQSNKDISAPNIEANLSWTYLDSFPVACPEGSYLTQLDDSVTCTTISNISNNVVTQNVTPDQNNLYSIGSSLLRWAKGWFVDLDVSGQATINTLNVTTGFSGSCANITYSGGIAISCND